MHPHRTFRRTAAVVLLVAAAALLIPAGALAKAPAASNRTFEIQGLVLGDRKIDASGELAILDGSIAASVGCNSIGGQASVSGDVVTVDGPLVTTEMACPGVAASTEQALMTILGLGPFTITDSAWVGLGGEILTVETSGPAPAGSPLDQPGQPVDSQPPVPVVTCPPNMENGDSTGSGGGVAGGAPGAAPGGAAGAPGASGNSDSEAGSGPGTPIEVPPATGIVAPGAPGIAPVPDPGSPLPLECAQAYGGTQGSAVPPRAAGSPTAEAALATDSSSGPSTPVLAIAGALVVLGLAGLGFFIRRRRAPTNAG